jgi:hypothetical protein
VKSNTFYLHLGCRGFKPDENIFGSIVETEPDTLLKSDILLLTKDYKIWTIKNEFLIETQSYCWKLKVLPGNVSKRREIKLKSE